MFWVLLLLLAWAFAGTACTRLCLSAVHAATPDTHDTDTTTVDRGHDLTLYEAAFLSGGPARVADVAMISMARQRRLLLAHTGWATVVDPRGRDEMEQCVIGAIGPQGQSRIQPVRARAAGGEAVRRLADRLERAGLAVPDGAGTTVAAAVRQVRAAALAAAVLGVTALLLPIQTDTPRSLVGLWFALPLTLSLSCLAIARFEVHPYSRWASPAGLRLLGALPRKPAGDERSFLASVAVRGIRAIGEPELRAAFTHRDQPWRE
ncbi:TIGR04222 domain-containing membrane protein [Streptomyces broussonetiae]|uniref:TIGR04222 domain-containing membrane protein n=1 Tax=Streptomyces broussonetiae TaxID=2686304 RepID=A0A6I6NA65_9ACTN|nr:TIGR04222 domain-containing membrane protein [Streptomyces broussonetiae]QHA07431.1 TIGR04222 domain-containing membrane protein [Streptomyces broussonetiae]